MYIKIMSGVGVVEENEPLRKVFLELYNLRKTQGEVYRAKAYYRAAEIIRDFPKKIKSSKDVKDIRGIGKSITAKIDEYIKTGEVSELKGVKPKITKKDKIIEKFKKIEGVGEVTAKKWYKLGYRKISDIPTKDLTYAQKIGVKYYDDIHQRIPRQEIQMFERMLKRYLRSDDIEFYIAGSYRRETKDSGDIDVLVIDSAKDTMEIVLECPLFTHTLAKGKKKWRGLGLIDEVYRRIDVEIVQKEEFPFAMLYFTGSAKHNVLMREKAKELGYRLNEKGLTDEKGNKVKGLKTEKDVYEFLEMKYLPPNKR